MSEDYKEKPTSRLPIFERLTAGLVKSKRKDLRMIKNHQKILKNITEISKQGRFGDTGSSIDQELSPSPPMTNIPNSLKDQKLKINLKNRSGRSLNPNARSGTIASTFLNSKVTFIYKVKSQIGKVNNKEKKANQDSFIIQRSNGYSLFGVLDGHGLYGHHASDLVKRILPKNIFKKKSSISHTMGGKLKQKETMKLQNRDISLGFKRVHRYIENNKLNFDPSYSGTTVNLCFINTDDKKLI